MTLKNEIYKCTYECLLHLKVRQKSLTILKISAYMKNWQGHEMLNMN